MASDGFELKGQMLLTGFKVIKRRNDWYDALLKYFLQKLVEELHTYVHVHMTFYGGHTQVLHQPI